MKDSNKRFAIIIALLGALACILIASYFRFIDLSQPSSHQAQLQALLRGNNASSQSPAKPSPPPSPETGNAASLPTVNPSETEFSSKLATPLADLGAAFEQQTERDVLPPNRIAPDLFSFAALPYDAPLAQFPLVLVGQKNLEWYMTPKETEFGVIGGINDPRSSLAGRPPPPESPPPSGPPGRPPPPPEVSNSGL